MVSAVHVVAAVMGGILFLVALASFFRPFWRSPPKRESSLDGMPGGVQGPDGFGSDGHANGGGGHAGH
jgi:hypothetical protein